MDRARTLLFQLRDFFMALPPARRVTFLGLSAGVLIGTLALAYWVQVPTYDMGVAAADYLIGKLTGVSVPRHTKIETNLTLRGTTGPATKPTGGR